MIYYDSESRSRLLIPKPLRNRVKQIFHADNRWDLTRVKIHAQKHVYWPNMTSDLKFFIEQCVYCQVNMPSHPKEPLIPSEPPIYPFQKVAADFFWSEESQLPHLRGQIFELEQNSPLPFRKEYISRADKSAETRVWGYRGSWRAVLWWRKKPYLLWSQGVVEELGSRAESFQCQLSLVQWEGRVCSEGCQEFGIK